MPNDSPTLDPGVKGNGNDGGGSGDGNDTGTTVKKTRPWEKKPDGKSGGSKKPPSRSNKPKETQRQAMPQNQRKPQGSTRSNAPSRGTHGTTHYGYTPPAYHAPVSIYYPPVHTQPVYTLPKPVVYAPPDPSWVTQAVQAVANSWEWAWSGVESAWSDVTSWGGWGEIGSGLETFGGWLDDASASFDELISPFLF